MLQQSFIDCSFDTRSLFGVGQYHPLNVNYKADTVRHLFWDQDRARTRPYPAIPVYQVFLPDVYCKIALIAEATLRVTRKKIGSLFKHCKYDTIFRKDFVHSWIKCKLQSRCYRVALPHKLYEEWWKCSLKNFDSFPSHFHTFTEEQKRQVSTI